MRISATDVFKNSFNNTMKNKILLAAALIGASVSLLGRIPWVGFLISVFLAPLTTGFVLTVSMMANKGRVNFEKALNHSGSCYSSLLGSSLLFGLIFGVSFILLILLAVPLYVLGFSTVTTSLVSFLFLILLATGATVFYYFSIRLGFFPYFILSGTKAMDSFGKSWRATKGNVLSIFNVSFLIGLVGLGVLLLAALIGFGISIISYTLLIPYIVLLIPVFLFLMAWHFVAKAELFYKMSLSRTPV